MNIFTRFEWVWVLQLATLSTPPRLIALVLLTLFEAVQKCVCVCVCIQFFYLTLGCASESLAHQDICQKHLADLFWISQRLVQQAPHMDWIDGFAPEDWASSWTEPFFWGWLMRRQMSSLGWRYRLGAIRPRTRPGAWCLTASHTLDPTQYTCIHKCTHMWFAIYIYTYW